MGIKCPRCGDPIKEKRVSSSLICFCGWWYSRLKNRLEARQTAAIIIQMILVTAFIGTASYIAVSPHHNVRDLLKSKPQQSLEVTHQNPSKKKVEKKHLAKKKTKKTKRSLAQRR